MPQKARARAIRKGNSGNTDAASAALPRSEIMDTIVGTPIPPIPPTETLDHTVPLAVLGQGVLGHGPYWINHVAYIQLSGERTVADTGPLSVITHDIGQCPRTLYFCTGTFLNDIELDLLLQSCVIMPNNAAFGYYMRPQFRTLITPPWARSAMQRYFGRIESQLAEMISTNPQFARGGPMMLLSAIHSANKFAFDAFLTEAKDNFCEAHPQEAEAWNQIIVQYPSRQYQGGPWGTNTLRTPVRLAATGLADDLQAVCNKVNARYYDHNGALHFTFYNGGFQDRDAQFPTGLNQGNLPNTLWVMTAASRMVDYNLSSLLFRWLQANDDFRDPWMQDDFTPAQASRSVSPRHSDATSMDVDS